VGPNVLENTLRVLPSDNRKYKESILKDLASTHTYTPIVYEDSRKLGVNKELK
jgi:hypothetical protein